MRKVLSIDGGGIRGIIPAFFLAEIESRTNKPIYQLFDLIAGTSTGGILALGLTKPDENDKTKNAYSANQLVELYQKEGMNIFPQTLSDKMGLGNILNEKYPSIGIEGVLAKYFQNSLLSESLTELIVTSYEIERRDTWIFKSIKARKDNKFDFKMKDIARATSAAPTYFEPVKILPEHGNEIYYMIDGGLYANNPAMLAYTDMIKNYELDEHFGCLMVSLGTGTTKKPVPYQKAKNWGIIKWAKPTIDILLSGTSWAIHNQLSIIFNKKERHQYNRFQCDLDDKFNDMDNAEPRYLEYYEKLIKNMIAEKSADIDILCKQLT